MSAAPPTIPDALLPAHYFSSGVYVKQFHLRTVDEEVETHVHTYDHLSLLASGTVRVTVDGVATVYTAPTAVTIHAGKVHHIAPLTPDCLWYCVHKIPEELLESGNALDSIDTVLIRKVAPDATA